MPHRDLSWRWLSLAFALGVSATLGLWAIGAAWWPRTTAAPEPGLRVQLMAGERVLRDGGGRLVLPADARFHVRAQAHQGGVLEIWATDPQGQPASSALYTSAVLPQQVIDSVPLRLRPPAGTETLHVRLRTNSRAVVAEEVFQMWPP